MRYLTFALFFSITLIGCSQLDLTLTEAIDVQEQVNNDNPDANNAFQCIKNVETDVDFLTDEIETVTIKLEANCLTTIAKSKLPEDSEEDD